MNRAAVAALLSALVFPGAGHFYLRRPRRAWLFLVPALVAAVIWFGDVATQVSTILDQVMSGAVAPDPVAIAARLEAQGGSSPIVQLAAIVFVVFWLASIIDSILVARSARSRRR
jgi:uncharacterized membrane protein YtjA (UPF0391 family)